MNCVIYIYYDKLLELSSCYFRMYSVIEKTNIIEIIDVEKRKIYN